MADELKAYSAVYARLSATESKLANLRAQIRANPELMAARVAPPDTGGFKGALDPLIPIVQAAFDEARKKGDFDGAEKIEAFLTRLCFWRMLSRDEIIASADARGTDAAMNALRAAAKELEATRKKFNQGGRDTDTAMTSLDELAETLGLKT